ncbi:MAG TPA: hypothetical protein VN606_14620 [Thermoleophilaceae bacterium]|nr:hypothetical protein [Thermoleophilaceae bacterium]
MRTPPNPEIAAPEFPDGTEWLNVAFLRMDKQLGRHAVLLEFWDYARINSLRTLPYTRAWHERYGEQGLRVIGVHSPGYSFGGEREGVERAVERLGIHYPVALDPHLAIWHVYGNKGWPARYLFDRRGWLRLIHYGEGEYLETELAIQELLREIDEDAAFPDPLEPLRAEDAPGVELRPQTADIALPGERDRVELARDWIDGPDYIEAADAGGGAAVKSFSAGQAFAVLSGDRVEPGLYEVPDGVVSAESPGLRLHGFQFTPIPPPERS